MVGTTLNGRFLLEKELGRGGMGTVYRARDAVLERTVAIKILKDLSSPDVARRVRLEAQILARLLHEQIVRLYDFNADASTSYFIMEEVDGSSFARRIKALSLPERLRVAAETAQALDYAHHQGVIHRDIKPANILLTSADRAKLSDFGLSMLTDSAQESGIVRGTPHYMSPEQAKGRKIDHRTDLYGLGVVLYECATGVLPFRGPVMSVMSQHINAEPDPPRRRNPAITEEFQALILALMAKDPADRPASGEEVVARIVSLIEGGKVAQETESSGRGMVALPSVSSGSSGGDDSRSGPLEVEDDSSGSPAGPSIATLDSLRGLRPEAAPGARSILAIVPRHPEAQALVKAVTAEPIPLQPDERYLYGHYLAYLLGGSRRRGFLLRRPLDPINADRARLLLAMTALTLPDGEGVDLDRAAKLLQDRPEVRPMLSPVVVAKYLLARSTPARRKRFRQIRQQLQQASEHAARHLTDEQGVLNPGLMPQKLDDLRRLAPARTEVDDELVERWNQVSEVWRTRPQFRETVLRYATRSAWKDRASADLWPEVVYPLIERARRQRHLRSNTEAVWDAVCGSLLHVGDAGVKLDRAIRAQVPSRVVHELDLAVSRLADDSVIEIEAPPEPPPSHDELPITAEVRQASFHDVEVDLPTRNLVRIVGPDPVRQTLGDLRVMWQEAASAMRAGTSAASERRWVPIGPYRLVVVPSVRSRSAGQLAIQGMINKQIEMIVPPLASGGPVTKLLVAVWLYANNSLAITHLDHLNHQKYIVWDASTAQQTNFDDAGQFNHQLFGMGMEVPDQLDRVLTRSFQPHSA